MDKIPTEISVYNLKQEARISIKLHHIRCTELKVLLHGASYIIVNMSNYVHTKYAQSCVSILHLFEVL